MPTNILMRGNRTTHSADTRFYPALQRNLILICLTMVLAACGETRVTSTQDNIDTQGDPVVVYNLATGDIPFPNFALFSLGILGGDGTINIPDLDESNFANPQVAMNASWGFSTNAPVTVSLSTAADSDSLTNSVKMYHFNINPVVQGQATVTAIYEDLTQNGGVNHATLCSQAMETLTSGDDFSPSLSGNSLVVTPKKVFSSDSYYLVVVSDAATTSAGTPYKADAIYQLLQGSSPLFDGSSSLVGIIPDAADAAKLEQLRQLTNMTEGLVKLCDSTGLNGHQIVVSWMFNTSPVGGMLQEAKDQVPTTVPSVLANTGVSTPGGGADIYAGTIDLPYYLHKATSPSDAMILSEFWKSAGTYLTPAHPAPDVTATVTVPLLVTIPKIPKGSQLGVVIFQHGITSNRGSMLGIADALASAGMVGVAIDLPLHGIKPDDSAPLNALYLNGARERHFDLDLNGDSTIDDSGSYFINMANLLVTRDNVQQAVADLFALHKAIETMDYDGGGADFTGMNVHFVGHSLGAIVGVPFVAMDSSIQSAVFGVPGGALPKVLDGSHTFGPLIAAGLDLNGVSKGSADYEKFLMAAQTVLDTTDPINFASQLSTDPRPLFGISVHNDLVVPNSVADFVSPIGTVDAPLAGTNPLFTTMGLTKYGASNSGAALHAWVEFGEDVVSGTCNDTTPIYVLHKTLLTPYDDNDMPQMVSAAVFTEMQQEVAVFLATSGTTLNIADNTYICAP